MQRAHALGRPICTVAQCNKKVNIEVAVFICCFWSYLWWGTVCCVLQEHTCTAKLLWWLVVLLLLSILCPVHPGLSMSLPVLPAVPGCLCSLLPCCLSILLGRASRGYRRSLEKPSCPESQWADLWHEGSTLIYPKSSLYSSIGKQPVPCF